MKLPPVVADLLRTVAPTAAAALPLPPPFGLIAAGAVSAALKHWLPAGAVEKPTASQVVAAVEQNAHDPAFLQDLRTAEERLKAVEKEYGIRFAEIEVRDRESARAFVRDTGTAVFTQRLGLGLLAQDGLTTLAVLIGSFLLMTGRYSIGDPNVFAALMGFIGVVLGRISSRADTYVNFAFGSSAGSREKSDQLGGALKDLGDALADAPKPPAPLPLPPPPVVVVPPVAPTEPEPEPDWQQGPHGGVRWRLTPEGVVLEGQTAPLRTVGQPATVRRIWEDYGPLIAASCATHGVPLEIAVACIATESRGKPRAVLVEPDKRLSVGLMQTLTSTASEVMGREVTAQELNDPAVSIEAGVRYLERLYPKTRHQPPLVAAAYNAGGLYKAREQDDNPFNLRSTGNHIERFLLFYNDACAVAAEQNWSHAAAGGSEAPSASPQGKEPRPHG